MFILFVSIISFGYLYEVFITKPDPSAILYHSIVPITVAEKNINHHLAKAQGKQTEVKMDHQ
jgi:hypothetical protein